MLCWHRIGVHAYSLVLLLSHLSPGDLTQKSHDCTSTGSGGEIGGVAGLVGAGSGISLLRKSAPCLHVSRSREIVLEELVGCAFQVVVEAKLVNCPRYDRIGAC